MDDSGRRDGIKNNAIGNIFLTDEEDIL